MTLSPLCVVYGLQFNIYLLDSTPLYQADFDLQITVFLRFGKRFVGISRIYPLTGAQQREIQLQDTVTCEFGSNGTSPCNLRTCGCFLH